MAGNHILLRLRNARDKARELRWKAATTVDNPDAFGLFCQFFVNITTDRPGVRVPLVWNRIQRRFMARRAGWDIVLKARQVGLTTLELARDLWFALCRNSVSVAVIVQPHKENLPRRKVVAQLRDMIEHLGHSVGAEWAGATVRFANQSTITVLDAGGSEEAAAKMGRGGTYHRAHVTELAHFPFAGPLLEALLAAVPTPERGGEFTVESTPRGVGGAFYDMWTNAQAGTNGLRPHFFAWFWMPNYCIHGEGSDEVADPRNPDEVEVCAAAALAGCPLSQGQLEWWRRRVALVGLRTVQQEFPHDPRSCFLLAGDSYFDRAALDRLDLVAQHATPLSLDALQRLARQQAEAGRGVAPYTARLAAFLSMVNRGNATVLRVFEAPQPGCDYLVSVDAAGGGVNGDFLVATVLNRKNHTHAATLRARVPPPDFTRWVHALALAYGAALVVVERNGHGGTVLHVLEHELEYPHLWRDAKGALGWYTGPHNRMPAIDTLADALLHDALKSPDPTFAAEARTFVRTKTGRIEADRGCTDDVVMSMVIGWSVLHSPRAPAKGPRKGLVGQAAP